MGASPSDDTRNLLSFLSLCNIGKHLAKPIINGNTATKGFTIMHDDRIAFH